MLKPAIELTDAMLSEHIGSIGGLEQIAFMRSHVRGGMDELLLLVPEHLRERVRNASPRFESFRRCSFVG
jgi:hypothetical protein